MKTLVRRSAVLALIGFVLSPLEVVHALPTPADSVHFCQLIDFEQWRRDHPRPAGKRLALNVGEPRTVRMIYFLPNDRPYRQEVVDSMKVAIRRVQTFYAEQMQAHGYGNRTFRIETDAQGEPLVHRVDGRHPDSRYIGRTYWTLYDDELEQRFDLERNIYLIVLDNSTDLIGNAGGTGGDRGKSGGRASVPGSVHFEVVAHELGHAFGLHHDFRDGSYIMSYGPGRDRLSACHAEFLSVHPYFNPKIPIEEGSPPTIELISPRTYPAGSGSVSIQLKVADSQGLHQVILVASAEPSGITVKACRGLSGERDAVVEFEYDGDVPSAFGSSSVSSLSDLIAHPLHIQVVDSEGDVARTNFMLVEVSPYLIATLEGHTEIVTSVAFSPDGTLLASGSWDDTVKLWDVATQERIANLHTDWVWSVSFSPDGTTLASGSSGTVILWDVRTGERIATLKGHTIVWGTNTLLAPVRSVSFSPDGATLASGSVDNTVKLWDVATQTEVATLQGHRDEVTSVAFSPDGTLLASGSSDNTVKLWDMATRERIATLGHGAAVNAVSFSPDGTLLASGSWDGMVKLWDMATRERIATLGHGAAVNAVSFSPDGTLLASGSWDGMVKLWDVLIREEIVTFWHTDGITSMSFSPDGTTLAAGGEDGTILLWDIEQTAHSLTKVSGDGQGGLVGEQLAKPFVVSVLDQDGSAFAGAVVTFSVTAGGGTLSAATVTTDANGRAATRLTLGSQPGTNTVEATVEGLEPETFTATAVVQTAHTLAKVSGDNQESPASTQLAAPFVVSVLDQDSSPLAGVDVTFSVAAGGGMLSSTTDASPCTITSSTSSTTATTDANGQAATRLTLGSGSGTNTVSATVEGLEPVTFTATAAEQAMPHSLTKVCGDSQEGTASILLAEPFLVSVSDEDGAAMAGVVVTFSVTAGGGTLSSATSTTAVNGRAATRLTLGSEPGTNTVAATVEGLEPVTFTATGQESPFVSLFDLFGGGKRVALPDSPQLAQNAPNPFNSQTVLSYFLLEPGPARLEVFALTGQRVAVLLHQGPQQAGYHRLHWDGRDDAGRPVASGMYLYRLVTNEVVLTRKLILLR